MRFVEYLKKIPLCTQALLALIGIKMALAVVYILAKTLPTES